jgi:hypothetical protein
MYVECREREKRCKNNMGYYLVLLKSQRKKKEKEINDS